MFSEEQLLPISALQHWLYCPRQCALIHLEQAWAENRFTAEGNALHKKAHDGPDETRRDIRITRSLPVRSFFHGIVGQCDIVEFHRDGTILPVEYKRGKPKAHHADEVQLCAQAMCLEEMLDASIPSGCLFYGEKRRRTDVTFDETLRDLVASTAREFRACITSGVTPMASYEPRKCNACSLMELCQPRSLRFKRGAAAWFASNLRSSLA